MDVCLGPLGSTARRTTSSSCPGRASGPWLRRDPSGACESRRSRAFTRSRPTRSPEPPHGSELNKSFGTFASRLRRKSSPRASGEPRALLACWRLLVYITSFLFHLERGYDSSNPVAPRKIRWEGLDPSCSHAAKRGLLVGAENGISPARTP